MSDTPTPDLDAQLRAARRTLRLYQVAAVLGVVLLMGFTGWVIYRNGQKVSAFGHQGEIWTVDLNARLSALHEDPNLVADVSETYFKADDATVHMHFMAAGQYTPLHLHKTTYEATVLAAGSAQITQMWGEEGEVRSRRATWPRHTLIASPPYSAHEWHNPATDGWLANLVFTAPEFAGNFYVKPDDPRLLQGAAPLVRKPKAAIGPVLDAGLDHRLEPLGAMDGRLHELVVTKLWTLAANRGKPVLGYVAAGQGTVGGHTLAPGVLVHLEADTPTVIEAAPDAPLAMVLFDPRRALGDG